MIASGANLHAFAGASFIAQAGGDDASLSSLAGYASFTSAAFFLLVSALRMTRTAKTAVTA